MPKVRLPIHEGMAPARPEIGTVTHGADMVNVYVDELKQINRWPGYEEFASTGETGSVDGGFWWENQQRAIVNCNGKTFQITDENGTIAEIAGDAFEVGARVKYADFGTHLYGANGGAINQISTSAVTAIADVDAPTEVTHVAVLDRYLIGNEVGTGNFHWADVNAPTDWSGYYSEAESNPDSLVALDAQKLSLALLGKKTLEKWYNDGTTPFIRLYQGIVQSGTVAPYSFTWCEGLKTWCWLDESRKVIQLQDGIPASLSLTMNKYIQGFGIVSDARGDYVELSGRPYYVLTFPSEEVTLVYDFISSNWYRLGSWNSGSAKYDRYRANCYFSCPAWNLTLAGDRANGKIYKLSPTIFSENGAVLRSLIQTTPYNHGIDDKLKFCNGLTIKLKRTQTVTDGATPSLMLQYRDNGKTSWTSERTITIQSLTDTEFIARVNRLGSYYSRQWRFYMTDSYPLCLVSVDEDLDLE